MQTQHTIVHHLQYLEIAICPKLPEVLADIKIQTKCHESAACWIFLLSHLPLLIALSSCLHRTELQPCKDAAASEPPMLWAVSGPRRALRTILCDITESYRVSPEPEGMQGCDSGEGRRIKELWGRTGQGC